jgi:hypothetical protein
VAAISGFWSYVQADNEAERGRIAQLAQDLRAEFEMLTGESIDLFLDRDSIEWGDAWREKVDASLATVAFFIPVLSPRYFQSAECRREFHAFATRATSLGIKELVLPLLYLDVALLHEENPADELATLVTTFQWEDWRDLRFVDRESEEYRRGVARLASRLVEANRRAEEANIPEAAAELERSLAGEGDEAPGILDRLADAERTMPEWTKTLEAIGLEIEAIGKVMQEATKEIQRGDTQGKGAAFRLAVTRRAANRLAQPSERIYSFGQEFARQLHTVDQGFRVIIDRIPIETAQDPTAKDQFCEFIRTVRTLSKAAREGLGGVQVMIDAIEPVESMSRDLRPTLRRLRQGLTTMLEAREVSNEWVRLIDETGIDCEDTAQESVGNESGASNDRA